MFLLSFCDCHRVCYYPFPTSFFSLTVSSLMVKWSFSLPQFLFLNYIIHPGKISLIPEAKAQELF